MLGWGQPGTLPAAGAAWSGGGRGTAPGVRSADTGAGQGSCPGTGRLVPSPVCHPDPKSPRGAEHHGVLVGLAGCPPCPDMRVRCSWAELQEAATVRDT